MPLSFEEQLKLEIAQEEQARRKSIGAQQVNQADAFILAATRDMPWQRTFLADQSSHKALFGERRGGKTTTMGIAAVSEALLRPFSQVLYIGLTQDSCERSFYTGVLARLLRAHDLPAKLVGNNMMRFDNGSVIYLIGLDANRKEKEKVRGIKSSLNMIDEMQSYTQDTQLILDEVLGPAAADTKAKTILGGTAGNALGENYWYEITKDNTKEIPIGPSVLHPEWQVYRCFWENNHAIEELTGQPVCDNVKEYLADRMLKHPGIETSDSWRQEWNAEWIVETSALIYRYHESNLLTSPLCVEVDTTRRIDMPSGEFLRTAVYILGIDLGYNDATALTVIAYNLRFSNKLYVIQTIHQSGLLVPEVAAKIQALDQTYKFAHMVGDSSSLQVFETMRQTYGFPIQKANRAGKLSHQLVLNGDLQTRSVVFMPGNDELIRQLSTCIWESKALREGKYKEDPRYHNDLSDSFLYAHNFGRHLWYEAPAVKTFTYTNQQRYHDITNRLLTRNQETEIDWSEPNSQGNDDF